MASQQGRPMIPPNPNNLVNNGMSSQSVRITNHTYSRPLLILLLTMRANYLVSALADWTNE